MSDNISSVLKANELFEGMFDDITPDIHLIFKQNIYNMEGNVTAVYVEKFNYVFDIEQDKTKMRDLISTRDYIPKNAFRILSNSIVWNLDIINKYISEEMYCTVSTAYENYNSTILYDYEYNYNTKKIIKPRKESLYRAVGDFVNICTRHGPIDDSNKLRLKLWSCSNTFSSLIVNRFDEIKSAMDSILSEINNLLEHYREYKNMMKEKARKSAWW